MGPRHAPATLRLYLDPTQPGSLETWLKAREIAGERPGELRVEFAPLFFVDPTTPEDRLLARWFVALAATGGTETALRILDRDPASHMLRQLASTEARRALAEAAGLDPARIESLLSDSTACLDARLRVARARFPPTAFRTFPPIYELEHAGRRKTLNNTNLFDQSTIRAKIDTTLGATAKTSQTPPSKYSATPDSPPRTHDRVYPGAGVVLGGEALETKLLLFSVTEDDHNLATLLAIALRARTQRPGALSIQVIARGTSPEAILMRRRLCAARKLGAEVEYLRYLAKGEEERILWDSRFKTLAHLEATAQGDGCTDDDWDDWDDGENADTPAGSARDAPSRSSGGRTSIFNLPPTPTLRSSWRNGVPIWHRDLKGIDWLLDVPAGTPGFLDWLWVADDPDDLGD